MKIFSLFELKNDNSNILEKEKEIEEWFLHATYMPNFVNEKTANQLLKLVSNDDKNALLHAIPMLQNMMLGDTEENKQNLIKIFEHKSLDFLS